MVSQGGTDTQMVVPATSDERLQQSVDDENDIILTEEEKGPDDTRYPISQHRSEVSCIVCTCPQIHFINIMGANCHNDVCLPVPIK